MEPLTAVPSELTRGYANAFTDMLARHNVLTTLPTLTPAELEAMDKEYTATQ